MSLPRPNESYHFQANLIWWDSPFNDFLILYRCGSVFFTFRHENTYKKCKNTSQYCYKRKIDALESIILSWAYSPDLLFL